MNAALRELRSGSATRTVTLSLEGRQYWRCSLALFECPRRPARIATTSRPTTRSSRQTGPSCRHSERKSIAAGPSARRRSWLRRPLPTAGNQPRCRTASQHTAATAADMGVVG